MSEFKETKGKWKIYKINDHDIRILDNKNNDITSVDSWMNDANKKENKANAKLIACAPKMLEMLKQSIKEINHLKDTYKDIGHCGKYLYQCEELIKRATT